MASPTLENLRHTLSTIRRRRTRLHTLHHVSLAVIAIVAWTFVLAGVEALLNPGRTGSVLLFVLLLGGIAAAVWVTAGRLRRLQGDDQSLAHFVEDRIPDLEQRLLTSLEFTSDEQGAGRAGVSRQFVRQLWADAEAHVQEQQARVEQVAESKTPWISLGAATAAFGVAVAALMLSEVMLSAASRLFWPFSSEPQVEIAVQEPAREILISLEPGDISMQRGESATIVARVTNAMPSEIQLRIQSDNVNWQDLSMPQEASGSDSASYSYFLPSVQESLVYYVNFEQNGEQRSEQFRITVYDLPRVETIEVAYEYPDYTGIEDNTEEDAGDMLVPEGTQVSLQVSFNKPIETASIEFQEGSGYASIPLSIDGSTGTASFTVAADGVYRIVARDFEDLESQDPADYYIRAIPDLPPELVLRSPGRDTDVMPLEEVVLEVDASDDYGLSEFNLHYNVVGSDEVAVDFLPQEQTRSISGAEMLYLEDLGVAPGDFVSYYLTLADNNGLSGPAQVVSDIYFLQVIPTDQEFRRAGGQQGGGGGGGGQQGGESSALVTLQKDIIAATWKLRNLPIDTDPATLADDIRVIAESQAEATTRAQQSIDRLAERLNFSDDSYDNAVMNLQLAIEQMNLAIAELEKQQVTSALKPEQVALQYVLKAEAEINRTDISTQQAGGGGGGGGAQQEREDLRELFEMEMGQLENRYETPQSAGGGGGGQATEEENTLEELARRQEGLTRAQRDLARRLEAMNEEQRRRELERLQREQEQLSQEVQQLAQQLARQQGGQRSQQSQQQPGAQGQQGGQVGQSQQSGQSQQNGQSQQAGASGGQSSPGQQQTAQQSAGQSGQSQLERAAQQMAEAAQAESPAQAAARSQRALESLREQQRQMRAEQTTSVSQLAQNAAQRGQQLLEDQRELQQALEAANRQQGLGQTRQTARSNEELQELVAEQQQQRRELEEIEKMLRAIIARGENEDQQLLSQAQQASRAIRPLRETMDTSGRVLSNGMVNLAVDLEREVGDSLEELGASLQAMNSVNQPRSADPIQQAARDAAELMEQMQALRNQVQELNGGDQSAASIAQMRQQLERSQQLSQQLAEQLQQQQMAERTAAQRGQLAQGGQPGQPGQQSQGGQQGGQQSGGQQGQAQQGQNAGGGDGRPGTGGTTLALGNARSIRSEITRQGIEDFLSQPELFEALLQPIMELEATLRAQAELDRVNQKLYASADEDVPDQYRRLVEEYYRVLSENNGAGGTAP
jgi:hypothetical protein